MDRYEVHVPCGKEVVVICKKSGENVKLVQNGETIYEVNIENNTNNNNNNNNKKNNTRPDVSLPDLATDEGTEKENEVEEKISEKEKMNGGKSSRRNGAARKNNVTKRKNQAGGSKVTTDQRGGKRGPNGYMKFANKIRPQILKEHPELKSDVVGVARKIGEKWRSLSDAEKKKY